MLFSLTKKTYFDLYDINIIFFFMFMSQKFYKDFSETQKKHTHFRLYVTRKVMFVTLW